MPTWNTEAKGATGIVDEEGESTGAGAGFDGKISSWVYSNVENMAST